MKLKEKLYTCITNGIMMHSTECKWVTYETVHFYFYEVYICLRDLIHFSTTYFLLHDARNLLRKLVSSERSGLVMRIVETEQDI